MKQSFPICDESMCEKGKILVFLGEGVHKIKKKAEQIACEEAINLLSTF